MSQASAPQTQPAEAPENTGAEPAEAARAKPGTSAPVPAPQQTDSEGKKPAPAGKPAPVSEKREAPPPAAAASGNAENKKPAPAAKPAPAEGKQDTSPPAAAPAGNAEGKTPASAEKPEPEKAEPRRPKGAEPPKPQPVQARSARGPSLAKVVVAAKPQAAAAPRPKLVAPAKPAPPPPASPPAISERLQNAIGPAVIRLRHRAIAASFALVVLLPTLLAAAYLWIVARDQYHSTVSFTVQSEEYRSASDLFSGLSRLAGASSSASDQDILYQYIRSEDLVTELDRNVDLRAIFSRNWPMDPLFAFNPEGSIEDLHKFWLRSIHVNQDSSGLMTVQVVAPTAQEAQLLTRSIFDMASVLVNRIAAATRDDAISYSRQELAQAESRLSQARQELVTFRLQTQIVDPSADLQGQMGIINSLQARLADTMIELDNLPPSIPAADPRRIRLEQTMASIERLVEQERRRFGEGGQGPGGEDFATLFSEYERLTSNMEFAEGTYRAAVSGYDSVLATAARQSRYLAPHVRPTLAERSLHPRRLQLAMIFFGFSVMIWALGVLIYYSVRDRR